MLVDLMLMLTPLTGIYKAALGFTLAVISVVLLILAIVFIVKAYKRRREGAPKGVITRYVVLLILSFFLAVGAGMVMLPSLISYRGHQNEVICAAISKKWEKTRTDSERGVVYGTFMIMTEDGRVYPASDEVFFDAKRGVTYYLEIKDGYCVAFYEVDEYECDV